MLVLGFGKKNAQLFLIGGESVLAEEGDINEGGEVKVMPLRFLVAAQAGSQDVDVGEDFIILLRSNSVWLSTSNWSMASLIVFAQKPCT